MEKTLSTWIVLALCTCSVAHAVEFLQLTDRDLFEYWEVSKEKSGPRFPVSLSRLAEKYGEIRHVYELTINAEGRPVDYHLVRIEPDEARADKTALRRLALFFRYRPGPKNPAGKPAHVSADIRIRDAEESR